MPGLVKILAAILGAAAASMLAMAPAASAGASDGAPVGAWRTTDQCFLAIFVLSEGGRARAVYLSGERDDDAAWSWDGSTLTITSMTFPLDRFAGHLANNHVEADYVWHDLDKDQLTRQACVFERFTPPGI